MYVPTISSIMMTSAPATSPSSSELRGPEELVAWDALEDQWLSSGGSEVRRVEVEEMGMEEMEGVK